MSEIFVVVEHRRGAIRDITWEMLNKAHSLKTNLAGGCTAVLLGWQIASLAEELAGRADRVLVVEDERLKHFDGFLYQEALAPLLQEYRPLITFIGQTYWGMDLAPGLAVKTGYPLATDCLDLLIENGRPQALRQLYGGKVFSRVSFREGPGYLATVRPGAFPSEPLMVSGGEIVQKVCPPDLPAPETIPGIPKIRSRGGGHCPGRISGLRRPRAWRSGKSAPGSGTG